jgi:hypothetical protein
VVGWGIGVLLGGIFVFFSRGVTVALGAIYDGVKLGVGVAAEINVGDEVTVEVEEAVEVNVSEIWGVAEGVVKSSAKAAMVIARSVLCVADGVSIPVFGMTKSEL